MRHLRNWGAIYVLLVLFVGSWLGQFFTQLSEFTTEQRTQGEAVAWGKFLNSFFATSLDNWQGEWLQLIIQAVLLMGGAKHFIFKAQAADLERIEGKVDEMHAMVRAASRSSGPTS